MTDWTKKSGKVVEMPKDGDPLGRATDAVADDDARAAAEARIALIEARLLRGESALEDHVTRGYIAVNFWGSHPDERNDDCWYGGTYESLVDAIQAYAEGHSDLDVVWVELVLPSGERVLRENPRDERALAERAELERVQRIRELAVEEGMLHGVGAYNDAMGQSLGAPEECGHHCHPDCPQCGWRDEEEEVRQALEDRWEEEEDFDKLRTEVKGLRTADEE